MNVVGFLLRGERGEQDSATSATEIHRCVSSSKTAWVYSIGAAVSSAMAPIADLITEFSPAVTETSESPRTTAPMVGYSMNAKSARNRGFGTNCDSASLPDVAQGWLLLRACGRRR